jgi:hypothetical protein
MCTARDEGVGPMVYCPNCGTANEEGTKYCKQCGRELADVAQARQAMNPSTGTAMVDGEGRMIADDGLPVGQDLDGVPGGERMIWKGRPSKLFSPIKALTNRYHLTNERLQIDNGFISRHHEELDLFRVQDVEMKQGLIARLVDMGDVWVFSSDTSDPVYRLKNVGDPVRVKDLLRQAARIERQRRRVIMRDEV